MKMLLRMLTIIGILICFALLPYTVSAGSTKIKMGHVAPPFHGQSKAVDAFAAYIKEKTNGKIDIATFPSGQLGGERSMAEQVQGGTLEIATIATSVLQNFVPECAITDMPFIFPNRKTAYATLDDPDVQKKIFSYFPKKGFIAIGWTENEIRDFTNNKRPVRNPSDIKGLKVRVMNSPVYIDTFKQLGASPVAIPFPETYNALQTGVVEAQANPILTSILMKFTEVTKYVTLTQHCLSECIIILGVDYWESLSASDKKIFIEAARIATTTNREANAQLHKMLPGINLSVADYAKTKGIEVISLTPAEREKFRVALAPVWVKYRNIIGNDIFDFMLAKIQQHLQ